MVAHTPMMADQIPEREEHMMAEKKLVLKNKYGETICELESTGMFFRVPRKDMEDVCTMLEEGDEFKVVAIDVD